MRRGGDERAAANARGRGKREGGDEQTNTQSRTEQSRRQDSEARTKQDRGRTQGNTLTASLPPCSPVLSFSNPLSHCAHPAARAPKPFQWPPPC
jgi:hypothetical protein